MKEGFCLCRFPDGNITKVAPLNYVRFKDSKKPFEPASSQDLPVEQMQVKWQRSMYGADDFANDGYYDATVLAIARSHDTILAKAKDLNIRLPSCSLITLPSPQPSPSNSGDKGRRRSRSSATSYESSGGHPKPSSGSRSSSGKSNQSQRRSPDHESTSENKKTKKRSVESSEKKGKRKAADTGEIVEMLKKPKPNKTARDPVRNERLAEIPNTALNSNPLMSHLRDSKEIVGKSCLIVSQSSNSPLAKTLETPKPIHENSPSAAEMREKNSIWTPEKLKAFEKALSANNQTSESRQFSFFSPSKSSKVSTPKSERVTPDYKVASPRTASKSFSMKENMTNPVQKEELAGLTGTAPNCSSMMPPDKKESVDVTPSFDFLSSIKMNPPSNFSPSSSSMKTARKRLEWTPQKNELDNSEALFADTQKSAKKMFPDPVKLRKQDSSSASSSSQASSDDVLEKTLPVEVEDIHPPSDSESGASSDTSEEDIVGKLMETEKQLKELKNKLAEAEAKAKLSNNMRLKYKEQIGTLQEEVKSLKNESKLFQEEISKLKGRNEWLQDQLISIKGSQARTKSQEKSSDDNRDEFITKDTKVYIKEDTTEDIEEDSKKDIKEVTKKEPNHSMVKLKKSKGKKPKIDFDSDTFLNEAYTKVYEHLSKKHELVADKEGHIDIGNKVKVKRDAFENNFEDNKLNLINATRNLASLAWTKSERLNRSLEGGVNNKYPEQPPKQMATPRKVMTVLGAIKAHMINQGDKPGERLNTTLKNCRKAIGVKLAQDSYNASRKKE